MYMWQVPQTRHQHHNRQHTFTPKCQQAAEKSAAHAVRHYRGQKRHQHENRKS
jgi:hypothetical protein